MSLVNLRKFVGSGSESITVGVLSLDCGVTGDLDEGRIDGSRLGNGDLFDLRSGDGLLDFLARSIASVVTSHALGEVSVGLVVGVVAVLRLVVVLALVVIIIISLFIELLALTVVVSASVFSGLSVVSVVAVSLVPVALAVLAVASSSFGLGSSSLVVARVVVVVAVLTHHALELLEVLVLAISVLSHLGVVFSSVDLNADRLEAFLQLLDLAIKASDDIFLRVDLVLSVGELMLNS